MVDLSKLLRVVVAVDPAVTSTEDSDETGIIVAGLNMARQGFILEDLSCRLSPDGWAKVAVQAYYDFQADRLIAEVNNGGDMVEAVIRTVDPLVSYKAIRASRGKMVRAEPVAALYEQGKVFHTKVFVDLEDQMCNYVPGLYEGLDDRLDALVWALTELMLDGGISEGLTPAEIEAEHQTGATARSLEESRRLSQSPMGRRLMGGMRRGL